MQQFKLVEITDYEGQRFYPDAVTTAGVEVAPAQLKAIADLIGSSRRREWFVKDSFHCLGLNSLGFEPLFDAEWIAMSGTRPDVRHDLPDYRSTIVTDEAGLIAWERSWAGEEAKAAAIPQPRVFMPRLLADDSIVFVSVQGEDGIAKMMHRAVAHVSGSRPLATASTSRAIVSRGHGQVPNASMDGQSMSTTNGLAWSQPRLQEGQNLAVDLAGAAGARLLWDQPAIPPAIEVRLGLVVGRSGNAIPVGNLRHRRIVVENWSGMTAPIRRLATLVALPPPVRLCVLPSVNVAWCLRHSVVPLPPRERADDDER